MQLSSSSFESFDPPSFFLLTLDHYLIVRVEWCKANLIFTRSIIVEGGEPGISTIKRQFKRCPQGNATSLREFHGYCKTRVIVMSVAYTWLCSWVKGIKESIPRPWRRMRIFSWRSSELLTNSKQLRGGGKSLLCGPAVMNRLLLFGGWQTTLCFAQWAFWQSLSQ